MRVALVVSGLETLGLLAMTVGIVVAAQSSSGSTVTATGPEVVIYLAFAALMGLLTWGLARRSTMVRTPYLLAQVFVGIVGYTVWVGDGTWALLAGMVILLVAAIGFVVGVLPAMGEALRDGGEDG